MVEVVADIVDLLGEQKQGYIQRTNRWNKKVADDGEAQIITVS